MTRVIIAVGAAVALAACTTAPPASAPAAPQEPPAAAPVDRAAIDRADALLADLAKREAAFKNTEAMPVARANEIPVVVERPRAETSSSAAPVTAAAPASQGPTTFSGHDEAWWKNEMRALEIRASDSLKKFDAAIAAMESARRQMDTKSLAIMTTAQDAFNRAERDAQQYKADVQNDRAAVERLREDARRANVPPGWLRWP